MLLHLENHRFIPGRARWKYMILDLKDNIVVVDGQPYSAIEVYITAKTTGKLVFNKLHGIQGRLEISGPTDIYYQDPGILIINSETPQSYSEKLEVVDTRKTLLQKQKQRSGSCLSLMQ